MVNDMVWSFSRLSSFNTCKMMWYLTYIRNCERRDNFFSQYGTFSHEVFEKYNKGELELFDIPDFICYNYDKNITIPAPPNNYVDLGEKYRFRLMEYFSNFNGWNDKTVGTEKEVEFTLNLCGMDRKFTGFIDRLSIDNDGNYIVTDYKSRGKFKSENEIEEYLHQPYLYSIAVKEEYGKYPKKLVFELFKENITCERNFTIKGLNKAKKWAECVIKNIYDEVEFPPNYSEFFCNYICSCAESCPVFTGRDVT